jgi:hypothetical protein
VSKQKRQLKVSVKGKSPNTVTVSFTESAMTEDGGIKKTEAETTEDDFAIGTAIYEAVAHHVEEFIGRLQEDEGPTLFESGKKASKA